MKPLLPYPSKNYIPKLFWDDPETTSLTNKLDTHLLAWLKDITDMKRFIRPDECPTWAINELGFLLNAGINVSDTEVVKRKKIRDAIVNQKLRGSWSLQVKPLVDAITGYDARIIHTTDSSSWIMFGGAEVSPETTYYWGTMGTDGVDTSTGLDLAGLFTEAEVEGNIYINLHYGVTTAVITTPILNALILELTGIVAYFKIHLGYLNGSGIFVEYTVI